MTIPLVIPDQAVRYILFQRTSYLRFPVTPLYRHALRHLPFQLPVYNLIIGAESRIGRSRVEALYSADMHSEYESIKDYLPETCAAVLDIGCGVAGIDIYVNRHYATQTPDFHLLDRSHVERRVYYMFNKRAAFYNSLDVARRLLIANYVAAHRVHTHDANPNSALDVPGGIDLVISLLAWGFHFPVETYAGQVRDRLSDDGVVILDLRKGTGGLASLKRIFGRVTIILETEKYDRVAVQR
jgi:SAM-dependent methyltransferase